jgi:hypothetical protein
MKTKKQSSFAGIAAAAVIITMLAFTLALTACPEPAAAAKSEEGPLPTPAAKKITWTADSKAYVLVITEISSGKFTYVLSVAGNTYSVGYVTITGNNYLFKPNSIAMNAGNTSDFTLTINSSTQKLTASSASIKLINDAGATTTAVTLDNSSGIDVTIADITGGGGETNNFVGTWSGGGGKVVVYANLTWRASFPGYNNTGTLACVGSKAIIYDSDGSFFGYASVSGNTMPTSTWDGGDITFTR